MSHHWAQSLRKVLSTELPNLQAVSEAAAAAPAARPGAWTRKQELGHLLDSAANNHIRFVHAGLGPEFRGPGYAQDNWVALHHYQDLPWNTLVDFWYRYNSLLAHLIGNIPGGSLSNPCTIGAAAPLTLGFVIEDYILHMQHHLDHILARPVITAYPSAIPKNA